ncbi:uncharacterized protein [Diabrotica undecimpunctata]|uniref:uncharacterized protein n=1 Tax=Diabrotica undecimpunctata TaxID=50387 RepID=UPI003B638E4B
MASLKDIFGVVHEWLTLNGFQISYSKSEVCVFSRHNIPKLSHIVLGSYNFSIKDSVKYLGMVLDRKLTWKMYINYMLDQCIKGLTFLKMDTKTWWGAGVGTALLFYRAYIRSILDYGCILYGSASSQILNKIDILQNSVLRVCLGAMKTTPVESLHVEAIEPHLNHRRQFLTDKFLLKISRTNSNLYSNIIVLNEHDLTNKYWSKKNYPLLCIALQSNQDILSDLYNPSSTLLDLYDYMSLFLNIKIEKTSYSDNFHININLLYSILASFEESVAIYTDASKSKDGVGCAFYIPSKNINYSYKLENIFSIFSAEAIAIYEALTFLSQCTIDSAIIISDSVSV